MEADKTTYWLKSEESYSEVPFVLKALLLFSLLTVAIDFYLNLFGPSEIKETIIPYTGWSLSTSYSFVAITLFFFISGQATKPFMSRNVIGLTLTLSIIFGVANFIYTFGHEDFGNPYLVVSQWRPIWTVLIPAIWISLLYTPRVRKYCEYYKPLVRM